MNIGEWRFVLRKLSGQSEEGDQIITGILSVVLTALYHLPAYLPPTCLGHQSDSLRTIKKGPDWGLLVMITRHPSSADFKQSKEVITTSVISAQYYTGLCMDCGIPVEILCQDQCQNQWRNGVLGIAQFPNTQ